MKKYKTFLTTHVDSAEFASRRNSFLTMLARVLVRDLRMNPHATSKNRKIKKGI